MYSGNRTRKIIGVLALAALTLAVPAVSAPYAAYADEDGSAAAGGKLDAAWNELARRYENRYASDDINDAPSIATLGSWWDALGDDRLTRLVMTSLQNNRDLRAARARVTEARAALGISRSARLPWLDSVNSWTRSESSENSANNGAQVEITRLGIDASWEIDIFGGLKEKDRAAAAALEAEHAALHAAWVALSSEVALNYLSLRTLQERLKISRKNLALQEETLVMLKSQHDAGLMDALALSQAQYTAEQTRAGIPTLQAGIEAAMNGLAILAGLVPGSLEEILAVPGVLPEPSSVNLVGIPADALRQRPDIRAAERSLAAQVSRKKSAELDRLPKFTLMGSIGLESLSAGNIFSGDSFGFSFGPRITLPIFHGESIRRNIQVQAAREEQLLAAYEGTVLAAVAEVRDALAASAQEFERNVALKSGIAAAHDALGVAGDRYRSGLADFSNVIGAQQALLSLEDQYAVSRGQMTSNIVRVFKALGGGWAPLTEESLGL